ncbi:hypothetical protein D3C74_227610 [compost metagenome]
MTSKLAKDFREEYEDINGWIYVFKIEDKYSKSKISQLKVLLGEMENYLIGLRDEEERAQIQLLDKEIRRAIKNETGLSYRKSHLMKSPRKSILHVLIGRKPISFKR